MDNTEVIMATNYAGLGKPEMGKVRDIYKIPERDELLIASTDRVSAFDVVLPNGIPYKGESIHALSVYWFELTRKIFPNHYKESFDNRAMLVRRAKRIDIEWIIRSYIYGSAWRAYAKGVRSISGIKLPSGLRKAEKLPEPILTPTTKAEKGHDLEISKQEATDKGLISKNEWEVLEEATHGLFDFYGHVAKQRGIIIPDFKLEFGKTHDGLIQIDEPPTHDSARFWDERFYRIGEQQEAHALDKEFLRQYLLSVGFEGKGAAPILPKIVMTEVSKRCFGANKVLRGEETVDELNLKTIEQVLQELRE